MAAVPVISWNVFSHCQLAGAGGLVQVVSILDLNGSIVGEWFKGGFIKAIPSPPLKSLGKGHWSHTLNTAGGSAGEEEGVIGSHIGETSGISSEGQGYGWDCTMRGKKKQCYKLILYKACNTNWRTRMKQRTTKLCTVKHILSTKWLLH